MSKRDTNKATNFWHFFEAAAQAARHAAQESGPPRVVRYTPFVVAKNRSIW
jgi:hypothetical protein